MEGFRTSKWVLEMPLVKGWMKQYSQLIREFMKLKDKRQWLDSKHCGEDNSRSAKAKLTKEINKLEFKLMQVRASLRCAGFYDEDFYKLTREEWWK